MEHAVGRLVELVEHLLDISRISVGRFDIDRSRVDLAAVVRSVVEPFEEQARRAGSPITFRAEREVIGRWDPMRLGQVVNNLLSNAIKYGAGQPIDVLVEGRAEVGRIVVRDRGIGMTDEEKARIFERYARMVPIHSYTGFGLGLWIARQIVEAHGGCISVSSRPGEGSVFTVDLPRDAEERPDAAESAEPGVLEATGGAPRA
jgi:signal transduction histidine kinase